MVLLQHGVDAGRQRFLRQLALRDAAALRNLAGIEQQFVFHGIGGVGAGVGQGVAVGHHGQPAG